MINLDNLNNEKIIELLDKYLIDNELEDDGDIFLENPARLYIRVEKDESVIRFMTFISTNILSSEQQKDILKTVNEANQASRTLKYSTISRDEAVEAILCEYALSLSGDVDDKFLIKTIRLIERDIIDFKTYFPD